ncbi:hypothetical protein [Desulfosporosinus hippei]|uniref:Uncharacterized protein n=1 Tax=Desulfosporosinus hippei DSM 8344 TaxID=1121419 RepID=A0A1G8FRU9_9FIRM|nr:hypothetical protein [Desulfosporosinus hippei]SDH84862.1 hypothetical protein SAMN05443529_12057 [Desulfosporosinus hippei DSM 8344]
MLKTTLFVIAACLIFIIWLELSLKVSRYLRTNRKLEIILYTTVLAIVIVLTTLWSTGLMGLWRNGISYIAYSANDYTNSNGHLIEGNHSISVDLSDLESNVGKDLYNDGTHRIYVSNVINVGNINSGGYSIGFRASGQYSLNKATLISGVRHATIDNNTFASHMTAKMTAEYNGKVYNCSEKATSGLHYQDGDHFSFYVFPSEAYENKEISLNEKGTLQLTVTNLYENIWSKI